MERITEYPYSFKIHGETINLEKNTFRRIDDNGVESRLSLVGDVIGESHSDTLQEWAIAVQYKEGVYCISKKNGMFGPFEKVDAIKFDEAKGISVVEGVLNGDAGEHPLEK